jgi:hypothetical protein
MTSAIRMADTGIKVALYAAACLALGAAKRLVPLPMLVRMLWRDAAGTRDPAREAREVAVALTASRWTGVRGRDCLQRSLLLYHLLSRAGADPVLVVGFRKRDDGIEGHAWVRVDGRAVADAEAGLSEFTPFVAFGARGSRHHPG